MSTEEISQKNILTLFETNREQRLQFARELVHNLKEGNGNALQVFKQLKAMSEIITTLLERGDKNKHADVANQFYELVETEFDKYGGKTVDAFGVKFQKKEGGVKYDYAKCGYPQLQEWEAKQQEYSERVAEFKKFLQNAPAAGFPLTDEETGEALIVYPPSKTSTTLIAVTLK